MRILICNWRDLKNPEGGGSEKYVETVAQGLANAGHEVTVFCAAHDFAPNDETVGKVRFVRRGTKLGVYPRALFGLLLRRFGRVDLVIDVQNGLPFFTRLGTRKPVVVLVHHVHREQWPVVYPGLTGRIGWFIESRVAPWLYRASQYITVSEASKAELVELGVDSQRIHVVRNGSEVSPDPSVQKNEYPRLCVVGRLVPHKQVEHAIDAVAELASKYPHLGLDIVGEGWWHEELVQYATSRGVSDRVTFHGFVDEASKIRLIESAWLMVLPSLKEGWGIVVTEAAALGTPTVAYRSAGGTTESIADGVTGVLADSEPEFISAIDALLGNDSLRLELGKNAQTNSQLHTWAETQLEFTAVISGIEKPGA